MRKNKRKWFDSEKISNEAIKVYEELEKEALERMNKNKNGRNK